MVNVLYPFEFSYPDVDGRPFPMLQISVSTLRHPDQPIDVDAFLDSGAERSLFHGAVANAIGLILLDGRPKHYSSAVGAGVDARMHRVLLSHNSLGVFELEVGFSLGYVARNLLGRDFFNLIQIGFREHELTFHIANTP